MNTLFLNQNGRHVTVDKPKLALWCTLYNREYSSKGQAKGKLSAKVSFCTQISSYNLIAFLHQDLQCTT